MAGYAPGRRRGHRPLVGGNPSCNGSSSGRCPQRLPGLVRQAHSQVMVDKKEHSV